MAILRSQNESTDFVMISATRINRCRAKLDDCIFHLLEVVSRYLNSQLHVAEKELYRF